MKLTFTDNNGTTTIPPEGSVYHNDKNINWVRYNGVTVWRKDISENTPLNLTASEGQIRKIFVDWSPPTNLVPDYYNLYRDGKLYKSRLTESHYSDTGLGDGESHEYYTTAVSGNNESNSSNTDRGVTKVISGSITFTKDGYFTVPDGITKIKICMIGGGAGGSSRNRRWFSYESAPGGKAGTLVERIIDVYPGQRFKVQIGEGGRRSISWNDDGGPGKATIFGNIIAKGGEEETHYGEGKITGQYGCGQNSKADGQRNTCTRRWRKDAYGYGGQGTIFGKGGDGGYSGYYWWSWNNCRNGKQAQDGQGYGAGGGGSGRYHWYYWGYKRRSGAGKQGVCIVSWGSSITNSSTPSTSSTSDINTNEILGYDVIENNFLNQIRYTTKDLIEKPEFLSKSVLKTIDSLIPEGENLVQNPEEK